MDTNNPPEWDDWWSADAIGEIVRVIGKTGNQLTLDEPLHHAYDAAQNPLIRPQGFVEHVGIEDLHINRIDNRDAHIILFKNAAWVWVLGVEMEWCYRTHVYAETVYRLEVRDSYFHDAHDHGGGGHGYGVANAFHTTNCLTENNIFIRLRHSMIVQLGASGNVYAHNYSREPQSEGSWTPCDISMHGHYPAYNLFEGNVVQEIDVSDYWGPVGPGNVFFRNCVEHEGLQVMDRSHEQDVVANALPLHNDGLNFIELSDSVNGTLLHGNFVGDALQWDPSTAERAIPASLYLRSAPPFFASLSWPAIGGHDLGAACVNPAQQRWDSGTATPAPTNW